MGAMAAHLLEFPLPLHSTLWSGRYLCIAINLLGDLVVGEAPLLPIAPEGGGAPIYAAASLLKSFMTIAGSYSVPFFSIPKKILVIFPAIAIRDCIFFSGFSFLVV